MCLSLAEFGQIGKSLDYPAVDRRALASEVAPVIAFASFQSFAKDFAVPGCPALLPCTR